MPEAWRRETALRSLVAELPYSRGSNAVDAVEDQKMIDKILKPLKPLASVISAKSIDEIREDDVDHPCHKDNQCKQFSHTHNYLKLIITRPAEPGQE